jgi:DNA polymerase-3 subunit beta
MEESRYTLNGGLLILKPDTLAMVATDGHRLALAETDQKLSGLNGEMKVLVPRKAMDEVEKLASTAGSEASTCRRRRSSGMTRPARASIRS